MPPRVAPQGQAARGSARGRPTTLARGGPQSPDNVLGIPSAHVETVGVRRSAFGSSGRRLEVQTNHFIAEIPREVIHHYDGQ